MLTLRRMRLVNWHFFEDAEIPFDEMTLLAGDNASGKSTIIDALQYALVANIQKIKFNAAATDQRGTRSLESYCRCKIGSDSLSYYRDDTISHVILEFAEGERRFCAGIMIESYCDSDLKESPWILKDAALDEIRVFDGEEFLPPRLFRDQIKQLGGTICSTKREYNSKLTYVLNVHRRNSEFNPYLETLVRSVSFTPLTSVDEFVCDYILEERQVDVSAMKENLENYREAEREALEMERKIQALRGIAKLQEETDQFRRQVLMQEYLRLRLTREITGLELEKDSDERMQAEREQEHTESRIAEIESERERLEEIRQELTFALATNDQHRLYERLAADRREAARKLEEHRARHERFETLTAECRTLLGREIKDISSTMREVEGDRERLADERAELRGREAEVRKSLGDAQREMRDLERGILTYPESTTKLKRELEEHEIDSWIYADLLEVNDADWQNAVEGRLNERRFDLLVSENDFHRAWEIYRAMPDEVAGVGIPNLKRMRDSEIRAGSLAEVIESGSPPARRYTAALLGDVVMATEETLLNFPDSVTKDCLIYADDTVYRIEPEIYERWYIGTSAKERRLKQLAEVCAALTAELEEITGTLREKARLDEDLRRAVDTLYTLRDLEDAEEAVRIAEDTVADLDLRLSAIDTSEFDDLRNQIASVLARLKEHERENSEAQRHLGALENRIQNLRIRCAELSELGEEQERELGAFRTDHADIEEDLEGYYRARVKPRTPLEERMRILGNFDSAMRGIRTRLERTEQECRKAKNEYNRLFNAYLDDSTEDSRPFIEELSRFEDTELPAYREKIMRAREEAETQFKEHFVSRLNEYITDAKDSFNEINHTLRTIKFGQDQYRFSISERDEKRGLLRVIREAATISELEGTMFERLTDPEERKVVESVFEQILTSDLDSPEIRDICDYRRYFTYDIRIRHTATLDPETKLPLESSLTRVLREKSGGETQTPYYVALGASFFRFFKDEPGAIRLAVFDEAFNKMDDDRIGNAIGFFRQLGMQILTAVPTEKIEIIAPFMDRINLVIRKDYRAHIRDYAVLTRELEDSRNIAGSTA